MSTDTLTLEVLAALDRTAKDDVIIEPVRASGSYLAKEIKRLAEELHAAGVGAGEPVALLGLPGIDTLVSFLSLRLCGAVVVLPDPHAGVDVTLARLASAGVQLTWASTTAILAAGPLRRLAIRRGLHLPSPADLTSLNGGGHVAATGLPVPGLSRPLSRIHLARDRVLPTRPGDAVVVPTSGTTGSPRSVVHTGASLTAAATGVGTLVGVTEGEIAVCGTFFAIIPAILAGARVAFPARSTRARLTQVSRGGVVYLTPPELRKLISARVDFGGARVYSGSAPVTHTLLEDLRRCGASQAWSVYAMTEIIPVASVEADEKSAWVRSHEGDLLGTLAPGIDARTNASGVLELRGSSMADRYLGGERLEWIDSGDIGYVDSRAGVVLSGRAKDMIIRGAHNIYPGLYEPRLHVEGVGLALLVGVSDEHADEQLVAFVETTEGAEVTRVLESLRHAFSSMGAYAPDAVLLGQVPLMGRSSKPDRVEASRIAARVLGGEHVPGVVVVQDGHR